MGSWLCTAMSSDCWWEYVQGTGWGKQHDLLRKGTRSPEERAQPTAGTVLKERTSYEMSNPELLKTTTSDFGLGPSCLPVSLDMSQLPPPSHRHLHEQVMVFPGSMQSTCSLHRVCFRSICFCLFFPSLQRLNNGLHAVQRVKGGVNLPSSESEKSMGSS